MTREAPLFSVGDRLHYGLAFLVEHFTRPRDPFGSVRRLKSRLNRKVLQRRGATVGQLVPVEEVEATLPIAEFRRKYLLPCRPVVLRGLARSWGCVQKWDPEFFSRKYASADVTLHNNRGLISPDAAQSFESVTMGSYLQGLEKGRAGKYLKFSQFLCEHRELLEDLDLEVLQRMQGNLTRHADYQLFIGGEGSHTPMHCGLPGNLFVQVYGRKRWLLFPARAYPAIDPPAARLSYFYSDVDPNHVDSESHPLFPLLDGYTAELEAGDVYWNPPFWWHCVTNDSDSIAIAYRFNSLRLALRCSRLLTVASFMATNPTIVEHAFRLLFKKEKALLTEEYARRGKD